MQSPTTCLILFFISIVALLVNSAQGATVVKHGLTFEEDSYEMFERVVHRTPWFVRSFSRNGMIKGIKAHNTDGVVTEELMYKVVKEVAPKKHLEGSLKALDDVRAGL